MVVFPGRRGITPVFGYTAPHPSVRGTSTLRIKTLPSTQYEALRLPAALPAALRCLRLAVPRLHPSFVPVAAGCADHGPGVGHPVPPPGIYRGGDGASQVPGEPV